jgi:hypothetical protein
MEQKLLGKQRLTKLFAVGLALLTLAFAAGVAAHVHANRLGDSTCLICHASHLGPIPLLATSGLAVSAVIARICPRATLPTNQKPFARHDGSRAPPALT